MQAGRPLGIGAPDKEMSTAVDGGALRKTELMGEVGIVAQTPTTEIHGARTGVPEFGEGRKLIAVGNGALVERKHLADGDTGANLGGIFLAWRAMHLRTRAPGGGIVWVAVDVTQHQGVTATIRRAGPASAIAVTDGDDVVPKSVDQGKAFTAIGEAAAEGSVGTDARIPLSE